MSKDLITWKLKRNNTCDNIVLTINNALKGHSIAFIGNIYNMSATENDSNSIRFSLVKAAKNGVHIHIYVDQHVANAMRQNRIVNRIMNMQSVVIHIVRDWKKFNIGEEMKFDVVIMNPPYSGNLHLKILEKVIPIADKVVNISPVRWLQDPLAKYKKYSDYKHFEDSISKKIKDLIIIPADKSNDLFNIAAFGDLGIYVLCNNGSYDYTQISKLSLGVSHNICSKMLNKLNDTLKNHYTLGCQTDYNVKVTDICGSFMGFVVNKIHNRIYKNELEYKNNKVKKSDCYNVNKGESFISFNTSIEAENFLKSVYTKFHRYIVLSLQKDVHVPLFALPFMGDYSKPWDDKRFCEYFGITGYIDDDHAEPNSEWEIMLNTMKEYM